MLGEVRGTVRFKEPLSFYTSLRTGGPADIFVVPQDLDDVRHTLSFANRQQLPVIVLGGGNKVLIPEGVVVVGCRLRCQRRPMAETQREIKRRLKQKNIAQPLALASAGAVWRDPPGLSAARVIERSGLRGKRVGSAEISTKQPNYIINRGGATAADVLRLMELTRERVRAQFRVTLEEDIQILGE